MIGLHHANVADALCLEGVDGLVDQADRGRGEDHPVPLGQGPFDDLCGQQRFSETGRCLADDALVPFSKRLLDLGNGPLLMRAKCFRRSGTVFLEQVEHQAAPLFWHR